MEINKEPVFPPALVSLSAFLLLFAVLNRTCLSFQKGPYSADTGRYSVESNSLSCIIHNTEIMSSENLNPKISAGSQLRRSTMRQLNVIIKIIILNTYGKDKTDSFK